MPFGHIEEGEIRALVAKDIFGGGKGIIRGNGYALVVLVKISQLGIISFGIVIGNAVELEIVLEIVDGKIIEDLVFHSVIGSVLVGLGHFHMGVSDRDLAVVGYAADNVRPIEQLTDAEKSSLANFIYKQNKEKENV